MTKSKYPFSTLEVGQEHAIELGAETKKTIRGRVSAAAAMYAKANPGVKFSTQTTESAIILKRIS